MPVNRTYITWIGVAVGICSVGLALAQTVPAFSVQPPAPQIVPTITPAPALKYRDPTKLITIGEISDLQAAKAQVDYASKFGYTDQKAVSDKPSGAGKADSHVLCKEYDEVFPIFNRR